MKVFKMKNQAVGALMRRYRIRKRMRAQEVALILGFSNESHLYRCEQGYLTFPVNKIPRAIDLFSIPMNEIIEAAVKDFKKSLREALKSEQPGS